MKDVPLAVQIELELQDEVMRARIIPCNRSWPKKQLSIRKGGSNYV
jgi:hypothetical protein